MEIALIIAMAYLIQVQAAAWYVKLTDRIFGPAEQALPRGATDLAVGVLAWWVANCNNWDWAR